MSRFAPFFVIPRAFGDAELQAVDELAAILPVDRARIASDGAPTLSDGARKAAVRWIFPDSVTGGRLFARVDEVLRAANALFWQFDLGAASLPIQYTQYDEVGSHYDWHADWGAAEGFKRKISISVQLCDTSEYEGGDLEFMTYPLTDAGRRQARARGTAIVFPAFLVHRVTAITSGARRALVTWRCGEVSLR